MVYTPSPEVRKCLLAARAGDRAAVREILKLWGYDALVREIIPGRPLPQRVKRAIARLTITVGTAWEDLLPAPLSDRKPLSRLVFDDEEK